MKLELATFGIDTLDPVMSQAILDEYTALAEKLAELTHLENWILCVEHPEYNPDHVLVRLSANASGTPSRVSIERDFNLRTQTLDHSLFKMSRNLQAGGVADIVTKTSVRVMDKIGWSKIELYANLDVGGYAWLRKGFFPDHEPGKAAAKLVDYAAGSRAAKLEAAVKGMSDAEVKAFVLSEDFRKHKKAFLGSEWQGGVDLNDEDARQALLKKFTPAVPPTVAPPSPRAPRELRPEPGARPLPDATLTNAAVRHQVYLERLKTAEVRDYNRLMPMLQAQVTDALGRLKDPVTDLTRARLNGLLRELRGAQAAALAQAQDRLMRRLRNIAAYESEFEARALTAQTPRGVAIAATTVDAAWASATSVPLSATGDLLEPFVRNRTQLEVDTINKVIMRGYSEGWTNDEITRVLRGTKKFNYQDGLFASLGKHNATLVRTSVQHVSNQAREAVWEDNDITEYRWVSTLDGRTTSKCRTLDGQVFTIGKGPRPPIHMNCRSTTVAIIPGLENLSDLITRASQDGQVKGSLTYYDWLKTQSAEFQDDVLGAKRAKLFRDGGLSSERFSQLQLNRSFEPLTLDEMKKLEPLAFRRAGIDDD